jgi:hypothetical protein
VVRLGQHDTAEHRVEPAVASSVQAMAHNSRRGRSRGATPAYGVSLVWVAKRWPGPRIPARVPPAIRLMPHNHVRGKTCPGEVLDLLSQPGVAGARTHGSATRGERSLTGAGAAWSLASTFWAYSYIVRPAVRTPPDSARSP